MGGGGSRRSGAEGVSAGLWRGGGGRSQVLKWAKCCGCDDFRFLEIFAKVAGFYASGGGPCSAAVLPLGLFVFLMSAIPPEEDALRILPQP